MQSPIRTLPRNTYICSSCLAKASRQQRKFSISPRNHAEASTSPPPTPPSSGLLKLPHRGLVELSGHDAPKFLQGLTTNNVDSLRLQPWYSGFLNAQGRVLWDALIYPFSTRPDGDPNYLIEVDKAEVPDFLRHLKRHKLRSKVKMRDAGDEYYIWASWDHTQQRVPSQAPAHVIWTQDPRLSAFGARLIARSDHDGQRMHELLELPDSKVSQEQYVLRRYLHGIPEGQKEILREAALPMESNMDYLNGIDFRKGCYVGQELTIRTQHTGVIRKRILPIQLYDESESIPNNLEYSNKKSYDIQQGADIKAEGGKRRAGKFLASVGNIGLALCRLENMTDLRVSAEGGSYKEGLEFFTPSKDGQGKVKIKAFVPEWLRAREQEKMERRARREDHAVE